MGNKRLIFYNDARHYHLYCFEPPISLEDAALPVREIAGTKVDTLVYGFGAGPTMYHLTKVGEVHGTRLRAFVDIPNVQRGTLPTWRAYENIMSLKERGVDILTLLAEQAHANGLKFYGSLRQTHGISSDEKESYFNWQFKIDHPEWCLKGRGKYGFNFIYPEVRAERFALAEEAVNEYDLDGFEIDWAFWPIFFEDDETEKGIPVLTAYMRELRRMVEKASAKRKKPISFGARVLPTREGNLTAAMDVDTWIKEGLIDFVVPNYYIDEQMDADFPFEWLVETSRGSGCKVFPALQRHIGRPKEPDGEPEGEKLATLDNYHAGAAAYLSKGADGIYLPWFNWPIGDTERKILSEINDPVLMANADKHYVVRGHKEDAAQHGYTAQLPLTLATGLDAPGQEIKVFCADDPKTAEATLGVRLRFTTIHDKLTVSVNGHAMNPATCRREPHNYTPTEAPMSGKGISSVAYTWLWYPVPKKVLVKGHNNVGIALYSRPHNLEGKVVLDRVDLVVKHRKI